MIPGREREGHLRSRAIRSVSLYGWRGNTEQKALTKLLFMSEKSYCMVLRVNIDCDGCYKKIHRALLQMHDLDSHLIEKTQNKLTVSGTFDPQSLVIRVRAATNRRVEILQATELSSATAPPGDTAAMRNQGDNVRYTSDGDSSCTTSKKKKKKKKKKRLNAA